MARARKVVPRGVRAGQVYVAKARRGWHRLRVHRVSFPKQEEPYALLVEIDKRGKRVSGRDRHGMPRREPFVSMLMFRDGAWHLNNFYTLEEAR